MAEKRDEVYFSPPTLQMLDWFEAQSDVSTLPCERLLAIGREIEDREQEIRELRLADPTQADVFDARLNQVKQSLVQSLHDCISSDLKELRTLVGDRPTWTEIAARVEATLNTVDRLTGAPDFQSRRSLAEEKRRLFGEKLKLEAKQHYECTRQELSEREQRGEDVSSLPAEAKNLMYRMQSYVDDAIAQGVSAEIIKELREYAEDSRRFYEIKRRAYEGAVTADAEQNFDQALSEYEYVRSQEGDGALVLAPSSVDAPEGDWSQMIVTKAIAIVRQRKRKELSAKAQRHINKIKQLLDDEGNPRAAQHELESIVGVEDLFEQQQKAVQQLRERISQELKDLKSFEQAVQQIEMAEPPIKAWEQLMRVGEKYQRFCAASRLWGTVRDKVSKRVQEAVMAELESAVTKYLGDSSPGALEQCLSQVEDRVWMWKDEFGQVVSAIYVLRNWGDGLADLFDRARSQLQTRDLDAAAATLRSIEDLTRNAARQLPERLADRIQVPDEHRRLSDVLASYKDAASLYRRLASRLDAAETISDLEQLVVEIKGHTDRVDEKYQGDFQRLGKLAEATYRYRLGKSILQVAGNYEEARNHLVLAAEHPEFRAIAQEEIAEIDRRLMPANKRVREALERADAYVQSGDWWEAYRQTAAVLFEPAEKQLRQEVAQRNDRYRQQALQESQDVLKRAIQSEEGQPNLLREHAVRLKELDNQAYQQLENRLQPLLYELEAKAAVRGGRWSEAAESYRTAAQELERRNGSPERVEALLQYAAGAAKQALLGLLEQAQQGNLEPAYLVEELKQQVQGQFDRDPDILLALAMAIVEKARKDEDHYEEHLEEFAELEGEPETDERTWRRDIAKLLREAEEICKKASIIAGQWHLSVQHRPVYERLRCEFMGWPVQREAQRRLDEMKKNTELVIKARKINAYKLEIVNLLSSISKRKLSETGK